ncbi:MAG: hypothetical protein H0T76_27820 [Nannocystis sp.]|nr:hypothetical protein [Nannocystis sp.]MBA3550301.1 hypothetical protein [Nannocystis sp.]
MKQLARERGGWCLSNQYDRAQSPLRWRCQRLHEWDARPAFVKQGTWCPVCGGVIPATIEQMHAMAAERGGQCLSTDYLNGLVKLRWRCAAGHTWTARPGSIKAGRWCRDCAGRGRISIETLQTLARERGGECLSTEYVRLTELLRWRCGKGHEWSSPASSVRNAGTWCPQCAGQRPKLSSLRAHAQDLGGECLAEEYRGGVEGLPWRCREGHTWSAPWGRVRGGAWCPLCARDPMRHYRPRLTLDVMRIYAARYGGQCLSDRYVHSSAKLVWRCAEGHVFEALQAAVVAGQWCSQCARARRGSLSGLLAMARDRGGECLEDEYLGVDVPYRWRCSEGHEWSAVARRVVRGAWCPVCASRNLRELETLDELAAERGGVCLSRTHMNMETPMFWRCARGHDWVEVPALIKGGSWCPVCAREQQASPVVVDPRPGRPPRRWP